MALADEILADLKTKRAGGGSPPGKPPPAPAAEEAEGDDYASDEEAAMADFEEAATPAEKVAALKAFMAICYPSLASKE